ncbi:MAG: helix-hairpin-helix domain-containing protein [Halobacteriota archaeon]
MSDESNTPPIGEATELKYVGPATAAVIEDAPFDADALGSKRVSYRMLVDAGVNPGVAAKIRREHSLSWSFSSGSDLERRSSHIRGLGEAEAAWIAASSGDWNDSATGSADRTPAESIDSGGVTDAERAWGDVDAALRTAETDGSGDAIEAEAAWRTRSKPTPISTLECIDQADIKTLAEAGITSVRSLATADADHVADVLELDRSTVRRWHDAATDVHE